MSFVELAIAICGACVLGCLLLLLLNKRAEGRIRKMLSGFNDRAADRLKRKRGEAE